MNVQILRNELQHVLSGKSSVRFGGTLQSITGYLSNCSGTSRAFEDQKRFKKQEEERKRKEEEELRIRQDMILAAQMKRYMLSKSKSKI